MGRVVRVARLGVTAGVPLRGVRVRERPVVAVALDEVGVRDERAPDGDHVRGAALDRSVRGVAVVPAVAHHRAAEDGAELLQRHGLALLVEAEREAVHHVQVREPVRVELGRDVRERLAVVVRTHVVEDAVRSEADADAVRREDLHDSVDDLPQQPEAVLDAPAVGVGALVRLRLQELVEQVAVRRVDLDAVEARGLGALRRLDVVLDDAGQFFGLQRARRLVGLLPAPRDVDALALHGDGRRRDGQLAAVEVGVRRPAAVPELEEDLGALRVDGVGHLPPALDHLVGVDAG